VGFGSPFGKVEKVMGIEVEREESGNAELLGLNFCGKRTMPFHLEKETSALVW